MANDPNRPTGIPGFDLNEAPFDVAELRSALADWAVRPLGRRSPAADVVIDDPPEQVRTLVVRVDVDDAKPPVWRRLRVRGDLTMDRLHLVIQAAFGWWNAHLHRFWLGPERQIWIGPYLLTDFDVDEGEEGVHEGEVRLDQVLREEGHRVFYTYDYGDEWNHTIKLESIEPLEPDAPEVVCVKGRREGPLEDIGGVWAHNDLVASAGSSGPAAEMVDPYSGAEWDPAEFDLEMINQAIELSLADPDEVNGLVREYMEELEAIHPGVSDLASRAPAELQDRLATAVGGVADPPLPEFVEGVVGPLERLLAMAGDGELELTQAGWLKPAVVEALFDEFAMDRFWYGKGNREDLTVPVQLLRETAMQMGLLRKYKGQLLLTRLGTGVRGDGDSLWRRLVEWLVPDEAGAGRDAVLLYLAEVVVSSEATLDHFSQVAADLGQVGWSIQGRPISRSEAMSLAEPACRVVQLLADILTGTHPDIAGDAIASLAEATLQG